MAVKMRVKIELPDYSDYIHCLADTSDFMNVGGVYIIYNKRGKVIYVGKATNLGGRIREHLSGTTHTAPFHKEMEYVQVYEFEHGADRDIMETYLINVLMPVYNVRKVYYQYDENEARAVSKEHRIESRKKNGTSDWYAQTKMLTKAEFEQYRKWSEYRGYVIDEFADEEEVA